MDVPNVTRNEYQLVCANLLYRNILINVARAL